MNGKGRSCAGVAISCPIATRALTPVRSALYSPRLKHEAGPCGEHGPAALSFGVKCFPVTSQSSFSRNVLGALLFLKPAFSVRVIGPW